MRRRAFIAAFLSAGGLPLSAGAQPSRTPVVGFLSSRSLEESARLVRAFEKGLQEAGYSDAKTLAIEYRWADGALGRLPALAAELVAQRITVLVTAGGASSALAAAAATSSIPTVFVIGGDPVKLGLVASMPRPGGNATGITIISAYLAPKRLELLRDLVPHARRFAVLTNPATPEGQVQSAEAIAAAQQLGLALTAFRAGDEKGIDAAFAALSGNEADALLVGSDPVFDVHRDKIVAAAARLRLTAIYTFREFAEAGGLITYGPDIADAYRQAGVYAGQIVKGAAPAALPVLQPTKFELVINLKTAKALGIRVPLTLQAQADEVIE